MDGTVSGSVFQDFGTTGIYTTGDAGAGVPRNRPIAGVTATAYDADGDAVGTATSAADGTYTINATGARSQDLRIEFSGWDQEVYQPGFAAADCRTGRRTRLERHLRPVRHARHR